MDTLYQELVNLAQRIEHGSLDIPEEIQIVLDDIISRYFLINK